MSLVQQVLGSGEMPSEVFQEHVLFWRGTVLLLCRKIPIFVGTSKVSKAWPLSHYGSNSPSP